MSDDRHRDGSNPANPADSADHEDPHPNAWSEQATAAHAEKCPARNVSVDCGWGKLIFADTFDDPMEIAQLLRAEGPDRRDIAAYVREPHVLLSLAPQELFLDPSHSFRLDLSEYEPDATPPSGFSIRRLSTRSDAEAMNVLFAARNMVRIPTDFFWTKRDPKALIVLVAEDDVTGEIVGTVMGVDHRALMGESVPGGSLWSLAVAPQARAPGIGKALSRRLAEHFRDRGHAWMDLSVLLDNEHAIRLYEKLGFRRVPFFTVKRKNEINEQLFVDTSDDEGLNPYALLIVREARRRGIHVEVTDAEGGFFRLSYGGRSVHCRESLSEFTTGVAMSICDDKAVTRRMVSKAGVRTPAQMAVTRKTEGADVDAFLAEHEMVVIKPARGEQGQGVAVGLSRREDVAAAIEAARRICERVLMEEFVEGDDLRVIVIDYRVVAAAVRRPASVVGDGRSTVRELIEAQSRRRAAATGGESMIPIDAETERAVAAAGFTLDDVLPAGRTIEVRRTANLHTGGTIHDVTAEVHPRLLNAAVRAARAIEIPVTGIDLIVKSPREPDYWFIEANERPGLANHEPQPTAERFVDMLFPLSVPRSVREVRQREVI